MELNIAMQFVMVRAQAEVAAVKGSEMGLEHIFLGILKLSEITAKDITSAKECYEEINMDIEQVKCIFAGRGIDTVRVRGQLRHMLRSYRFTPDRDPKNEIVQALNKADYACKLVGSNRLTAAAVLLAILEAPPAVVEEACPVKQQDRPGQEVAGTKSGQGKHEQEEKSGEEDIPEMGLRFLPQLTSKIRNMRSKLLSAVHGQDHVVHAFAEGMFSAEVLAAADEKRKRPRAIFVFAGPPGVGKTFLAEQAAEALAIPFKRFDMSNFSDHQAYINLIGFEKSYKDAKPGTLTGFVKENPHSILLFDEVEKANMSTIHLFLQVLDAGRLNDKFLDEDIMFKDTIIIFTSNAGRSLYEGDHKQNAAGISRKTIINALETERNPQTGQPFFPAAICSRMATGRFRESSFHLKS